MRYWIFQNNQVNGPFEPDDLSQVSGFSAEALVCPEGRRGTNMGDWQRAGMVPELSVALIKATQLAAAPVGVGGGIFGTLPPEPTLKDLAALGSLQEKISVLEGVLSQMQDALRLKDEELLALHREVEEKKRREAELASKLGGLEERLANVQSLRANLDQAIADEKKVESTVKEVEHSVKDVETSVKEMELVVESQRETIDRLLSELEKLKEERKHDARTLEEIKSRPSGSGPAAPAKLEMLSPLESMAPPTPANKPLDVVAPPPAPVKQLGGLEPVLDLDAPAPAPVMPPPPAPMSLEPAPLPMPEAPKPLYSDAPPVPMMGEAPKADLKPADVPPPPVVDAPPAPAATARSKKVPIMIAVGVVAALGAGSMFMGGSKTPELAPVEAPAEPAPAEQAPAEPPVDTLLQEQKEQALGLLRMWPSGDGATVGQRLEAMPPSPTQAAPWFVDKLSEGLFLVNYYAAGGEGQIVYQFQVRPVEKQVAPMNVPAKDLLEPKKPEPPKAVEKPKKKVRVRPKAEPKPAEESSLLDQDPLQAALDEQPKKAPEPKTPRRKPAAKKADDEATLDQLLEGDPEPVEQLPLPDEPAAAAKAKAQTPRPAPKSKADDGEPSDAELLDELLKP